jgi:hypothetical protein
VASGESLELRKLEANKIMPVGNRIIATLQPHASMVLLL